MRHSDVSCLTPALEVFRFWPASSISLPSRNRVSGGFITLLIYLNVGDSSSSNLHHRRVSVSVVACPGFEPTIRQVSEFRRTIGGNIADLRRVGKNGSGQRSLATKFLRFCLPSFDLLRSPALNGSASSLPTFELVP